ncbi:MAG: ribonuclease D [Desulfuromonas sp.]|nr:MAG: ribonuclease D [Desulfuromonas sp.]
MNNVPMITEQSDLSALAARLQQHERVAVDLEADSMHHYTDKVCLLQFSSPEETCLVDPLALPDLEPLRSLFENPTIEKLFHAGDYDLRSLRRDFNLQVRGLVDTMLAAQFCGEARIGLADLLNKYFSVELDKKFQRADWSIRPLPDGMVHYAAEDTRHLHRLAELLRDRLANLGRMSWLEEECALLEEVSFDQGSGPMFLRFKGAGRLGRRQLAILEELLRWRDREAQRRDVPPFKIFGNKHLLEVIQVAPATKRALFAVPGVPSKLVQRYTAQLLDCVAKGEGVPEGELPVFPRGERRRKDPEEAVRMERLKRWRVKKAEELQLDPGVMVNNALLEAVARCVPRTREDLEEIHFMRDWQRREFGDDLISVANG